jgi:hypothetical protein
VMARNARACHRLPEVHCGHCPTAQPGAK